jgi:hypothetical protein
MKRCRVEVVRNNNGRSKWGLEGKLGFLKKMCFFLRHRAFSGGHQRPSDRGGSAEESEAGKLLQLCCL